MSIWQTIWNIKAERGSQAANRGQTGWRGGAHGCGRPAGPTGMRGGLTSAQGQGGGRGPAAAPPLAQAALQLLQPQLLLQHRSLPLAPGLPADVLLAAQPPGRLCDLQLQGQLALQAAQGVLPRGGGVSGGPRHREAPRPQARGGGGAGSAPGARRRRAASGPARPSEEPGRAGAERDTSAPEPTGLRRRAREACRLPLHGEGTRRSGGGGTAGGRSNLSEQAGASPGRRPSNALIFCPLRTGKAKPGVLPRAPGSQWHAFPGVPCPRQPSPLPGRGGGPGPWQPSLRGRGLARPLGSEGGFPPHSPPGARPARPVCRRRRPCGGPWGPSPLA